MRIRAAAALAIALALGWALPLLGLALAGAPVAPFLGFPPRTEAVAPAAFDWRVFALLSLPPLAAIGLYVAALRRARPAPRELPRGRRFPWWGHAGLALIALGWMLAWSAAVPPEWRRHTFTPLWLGYVLVMNALAYRRSGRSLLTHRTAFLAALFPLSAVFWWLFEHLNQFVDNWHYSCIVARDDWDYFWQATLPFSTVLPAVASTGFWLKTFARLDALPLPPVEGSRRLAWLSLAAGVAGLAGIGICPDKLFSMLWLAPLLVLAGLQPLVLGESSFAPLRRGDWRPLLQPALAALACGVVWELWNAGSLAQWHYSVPYVQRFLVFEMPLLGYAGYLPFGVECALVMDVAGRMVEGKRRG